MKKFLVMLMLVLGTTVFLKQTACMTYKGWGRFDPPCRIELKEMTTGPNGVSGVTKEGKKVFIPWDAISYMEET